MKIIVKKFGGTSLSDIDRINRAISYIKKTKSAGYKVVIVVSAMGKETDHGFQQHFTKWVLPCMALV